MDKRQVNGHTSLYAVIGSPVKHSKSPAIYNAAFAQDQVNSVYLAFEADEDATPTTIAALKQLGVKGINVTMPGKDVALGSVDELDAAAEYVQAINCLVQQDEAGGKWKGYNTDGIGFWASVKKATTRSLVKQSVLIFGSGNTARIILAQAVLEGVPNITVVARGIDHRPLAIIELASKLASSHAVKIQVIDLASTLTVQAALTTSDIVVQATSLGMAPLTNQSILPEGVVFKSGALACDIVYNPAETQFLKAAQLQGCQTLGGIHMLVEQAAVNYQLFTGKELDAEVMLDLLNQTQD